MIGIYEFNDTELLVHIVDTIEEASKWIQCTPRALYLNLKLHGIMHAKGYKLERI